MKSRRQIRRDRIRANRERNRLKLARRKLERFIGPQPPLLRIPRNLYRESPLVFYFNSFAITQIPQIPPFFRHASRRKKAGVK